VLTIAPGMVFGTSQRADWHVPPPHCASLVQSMVGSLVQKRKCAAQMPSSPHWLSAVHCCERSVLQKRITGRQRAPSVQSVSRTHDAWLLLHSLGTRSLFTQRAPPQSVSPPHGWLGLFAQKLHGKLAAPCGVPHDLLSS
jgi:hypothetical protein